MSIVWVAASAVGAFLGATLAAVLSDLISEEVRSRLDGLPRALVRLAARLLPRDQRTAYEGDWLGVLDEILHGSEARPITRLVRGGSFGAGLLFRGAWCVREEFASGEQRVKRLTLRWTRTTAFLTAGALTLQGLEWVVVQRLNVGTSEEFMTWASVGVLLMFLGMTGQAVVQIWRLRRAVEERIRRDNPGLNEEELSALCAQARSEVFRMKNVV